jgi:exopolyphosphatase/pppGpp-phosphohydrolase
MCHELSQIQMTMTKIKELYQKIEQIKQKKNLKVEQVSADRVDYDIQ